MLKKLIISCLSAVLSLTMSGTAGQPTEKTAEFGRLEITEPGTYVLNGKMEGTVYVDPGEGDVRLVLDGADINGGNAPAIYAVSGDSLTIELPEGSVSRLTDGEENKDFGSVIFSRIDTFFEGNGSLYIFGSRKDGVHVEDAQLIFNGGAFAVKAPENGIITCGNRPLGIQFNGGHFSIQADTPVNPGAEMIRTGGAFENEAQMPEGLRMEDIAENEHHEPQQTAQKAPAEPSGWEHGSEPSGETASQLPEIPAADQSASAITGNTDTAGEIAEGTVTNSAAELEADYENATYITVSDDNNDIVITSSGTYVVSGTCSDGNITVKKGTTGVVLVLENLDLTSTTGAAVSVNKNAEVKIIISGNVVLTDNENPDDEDSEDEDVADAYDGAALKIKDGSQVYITGDGTLTINGNAKNGIKAGDETSLIFDGVTVNITAVNDGINGSYDVTLLSGEFTINAGDDAIHADHILTIGSEDGTGPVINVESCVEGLEGTVVNIYGGNISITSSDDAINAANGDGTYEGVLDYSFNMMGGTVTIDSTGDGIDSNGNVNLIGGTAVIHSSSEGGESGIDYDGDLYISDEFKLNNASGTSGADAMMPGQMNQMPADNSFRHK